MFCNFILHPYLLHFACQLSTAGFPLDLLYFSQFYAVFFTTIVVFLLYKASFVLILPQISAAIDVIITFIY